MAAATILIVGVGSGEAQQPLRFGARADAPPMSYQSNDGKYRGYVIDICNAIKETYAELHPGAVVADGYVKVTAATRGEMLLTGKVDIVCGPFSMTEKRMKDFDFSFPVFVSGASVAARRQVEALLAPANLETEKAPDKVAVVSDTTTQELVERLLGTSVELEPMETHDQAFAALTAGKVSYYFGDRAILNSVVGDSENASDFVVGGFLTYEPYALPFARGKNAELRHAANVTIARLYRSKGIRDIYQSHFPDRTPSPLLESLYQLYALPE